MSPLKGVAGNMPYPLFCLMRDPSETNLEDALLDSKPLDNVRLSEYIEAQFGQSRLPCCRPFITTDDHADFKNVPEEFERARQEMINNDQAQGLGIAQSEQDDANVEFTDVKLKLKPPDEQPESSL